MDCQEVARGELAEEYLRGRLEATQQDDFEAHILECEHCLRTVEALQALRNDLKRRAHEIRAYSGSQGNFRWSWLAVAALFLVVGGLVVRQVRQQRTGVAQQKPTQQNVATNSASGASETASQGVQQSPPPAQVAHSPALNARGPKSTVSPQTVQKPGEEDKSTSPTPVVAANPENTPVPDSQVAVVTPGSVGKSAGTKSPQPSATASGLMSDDGERELFRLGSVRAPAYDFSGVATHGTASPGSGATTERTPLSGEQRALFERAMRAYVDGNYDETIDLLQSVLAADSNAADANFYLGVALLLKGRPDQAFAPLKVAAANPRTRWAQPAHYYLAKAYLQTRDLASAELELKAAAGITGSLTASARSDLASVQALRAKENR